MSKRIAIIRNGQIIYGDDLIANTTVPSETAARESRQDQSVRFRKDMLQKNQVEYYRAYPDQAKGLSPELRRLLS